MLKKKMLRDIRNNLSQFLTIFSMVLIGIMVYTGIEAYMDGMINTADKFYSENNLQDLNVIGQGFTNDDLDKIKKLDNVNDAERKLVFNAINGDDENKNYLVSFIETNNISKFHIVDGIDFDASKSGVWIDEFYAKENDLKVGDSIKIKYDGIDFNEKILALVNVPDHLYDLKDESSLLPNRTEYGFVFMSINEFPSDYVKKNLMKKMDISDESVFDSMVKDFNYIDYIPFNYIMVDVDSKDNVNSVKNSISEKISNASLIVKIEDTSSYSSYQGEIDEGSAYVGIFSGLFLFIAMLSVITTMTRVVKKQKIQIGTLKALGFSNRKILFHYIGYGFWVSLFGAICGIICGKYFLGKAFLDMEMSVFEIPNGKIVINTFSYIVSIIVVLVVSLITYLTCRKNLSSNPAETLRNELPKVKSGSLNITSKGIFKKMSFSNKWNVRDIIRNKFRTITGLIGIIGCCMLIVCAFGMLDSMDHFISLQFDELYNFDYRLSLKEDLSDKDISELQKKYGSASSMSLGIEIKNDNNNDSNNIFVTDASDYVRFKDNKDNYIKIDNDDGVYITYKLADKYNYKVGDYVNWHIYGDSKYYKSKIVGLNRDPQNQNMTMTRSYLESLGIKYVPDNIYTNMDLSNNKSIDNVSIVQDVNSLKNDISQMLDQMHAMIVIIIVFAVLLGVIIIYNMGILSYSEKQYQFATLKVLGFKDKKIKSIFIKQNNWITIVAIMIGLPAGYYLTSWIFSAVLEERYDFGAYVDIVTFVIAIFGTFFVSYVVSNILARKIKGIDMVSSLKANE